MTEVPGPHSGALDLRLFHEMSLEEQQALWASAEGYFAQEAEALQGLGTFPHLDALDVAIADGKLIPVQPNTDFGIVAPIRNRYAINRLQESEGSVPYLLSGPAQRLAHIAHDIHVAGAEHEFGHRLVDAGFTDFLIGATSLTRTSHYQRRLATNGRFARKGAFEDDSSAHETGRGFDIDHTAFYATQADGSEVALTPLLPPKELERYKKLVPAFRNLVQGVVVQHTDGPDVMALHEVPNGWGVWHVVSLE
jgi:hypothetical protein